MRFSKRSSRCPFSKRRISPRRYLLGEIRRFENGQRLDRFENLINLGHLFPLPGSALPLTPLELPPAVTLQVLPPQWALQPLLVLLPLRAVRLPPALPPL